MRPLKIILPLIAAVCGLAVSNARAVAVASPAFTNFVTIGIVAQGQGTSTTNTVNSTTSFAKPIKGTFNTALLLEELGGVTIGTNFSKSAKLVYIEGGSGTNGFAVIDGAKFVSVSNIMSLNTSISTNEVKSGTQSNTNGLALKTLSNLSIVELDYDDTIAGVNGSLAFNLRGIATTTTTDTVPSNGSYTKTFSAKLTGTGSGVSAAPFVLTGTASFSGSGVLILQPPT
jgi:hypothetical protein